MKAAMAALEKRMRNAASNLEFEEAARLRDEIRRLEALELGLEPPPMPSASLRPRKNRTPEPMGPGGGGYDPSKRRGRGGMRRKGP
jgi:excinuclease ABC subunit B